MSRRLEIELTSERPDGTWTWRAAGARQPKGEMDGGLLPAGSNVGDVLRADAEFLVDGIEIVGVLPPKGMRKEPERLQILGSGREEPLVTTQLAPRRGRGDRDRDRGPRRDRGERGDRDRRDRRDRPGGDRPRGPRPDPVPERPRPKRLRPGRTHRNTVVAGLPPEQQPVAEQVLRGGLPAVREAIAKQNEQAKSESRPEIDGKELLTLAERLTPALRAADWLDRAEAARRDLDVLDLRDLRSVVVAADGVARDEESRALLEELRVGLNRRVEEEHRLWIGDITANLDAGRFVRALRLSSRPPKAGTPVPQDLAARLVDDVSAGLTDRTNQELWAAALDALAVSPVRAQVTPTSKPAEPTEDLLEAVRRVSDRLPAIAALFGVDPSEAAAAKRRAAKAARARGGRSTPRQVTADTAAGSANGAGVSAPATPSPPPADRPERTSEDAATKDAATEDAATEDAATEDTGTETAADEQASTDPATPEEQALTEPAATDGAALSEPAPADEPAPSAPTPAEAPSDDAADSVATSEPASTPDEGTEPTP
jgi:hypothetical protein